MNDICTNKKGVVDYDFLDTKSMDKLDEIFVDKFRDEMDWTFENYEKVRAVWKDYSAAVLQVLTERASNSDLVLFQGRKEWWEKCLTYKEGYDCLPLVTNSVLVYWAETFKSVNWALFEVSNSFFSLRRLESTNLRTIGARARRSHSAHLRACADRTAPTCARAQIARCPPARTRRSHGAHLRARADRTVPTCAQVGEHRSARDRCARAQIARCPPARVRRSHGAHLRAGRSRACLRRSESIVLRMDSDWKLR
jgi:hypothetical protein